MITTVISRGVHATADLHRDALTGRTLPLLVVHLAAALEDEAPAHDFLLWRLRGQGWGNPAALLRGGDLDCLARATVDGALDGEDAPVTVAFQGHVLFHGPVLRSEGWRDCARTLGGLPVLLTTAAAGNALWVVARDGLLVAAWARFFHRGAGVAPPAL